MDSDLHSVSSSMIDTAPEAVAFVSGIPADEIRSALREVLQSSAFIRSKRCRDFLSFVVEQTLTGQQGELKERTIGAAVFGRNAAYDTNEDAIVRIKASEVRKRLGYYYADEGKTAGVVIRVPQGGYVPAFSSPDDEKEQRTALPEVAAETEVEVPILAGPSHAKSRLVHFTGGQKLFAGILLAAVATFAIVIGFRHKTSLSVMNGFWNPVFRSSAPVLLVTSTVPAYIPHVLTIADAKGSATEYDLTTDQFVGQGDARSAELISAALQRLGHTSRMYGSNNAEFHELSGHSLVLIGYASTQWSAMSQGLRFRFSDRKDGMILDHGRPTEWYPHHIARDLHTDEDYALVSRVYVPEAQAELVIVSGGTQYGTEAAAELVTDPALLSASLQDAPKDWPHKNLQLVLHLKVIGDTPEKPQIVASEFW